MASTTTMASPTTTTPPNPSDAPQDKGNATSIAYIVVSVLLIVGFVTVIVLLTLHNRRRVARRASTDRSDADIEMQPPPAPQGDGTFRVGQFTQRAAEPERAEPRTLKKARKDDGFVGQAVAGDGDAEVRVDGQQRRQADRLMQPQVDDMEIRPVRV